QGKAHPQEEGPEVPRCQGRQGRDPRQQEVIGRGNHPSKQQTRVCFPGTRVCCISVICHWSLVTRRNSTQDVHQQQARRTGYGLPSPSRGRFRHAIACPTCCLF